MQPETMRYQRLDLAIAVPYTILLEAIAAWFALDLISELDLQWRNTRLDGNRLVLMARLNKNILQGLDLWMRMGLLSDQQVRLICSTRFTSELPAFAQENSFVIPPAESPIPSFDWDFPDMEPAGSTSTRIQPSRPQTTVQPPNRTAQMVQSLISEFSTVWLLFLGVFLVVVSSGVLAVSQWNQFPPQGQYTILLAYTLVFWGVSVWTKRQENLSLTTRTLEILTLLVIPVNFWAIDRFQLLSNPLGLIESAIASVVLAGVTLFLLKQHGASKLTALNCVGLSALHIGWGFAGYPLIAVYIGTVGTAAIFFLQQNRNPEERITKLALGEIAIAYTTLILLFRAVFVEGVAIADLGLAFGICGWLASKLNLKQGSESQNPQFKIAAGLILLGWGVSVRAQFPWQAVAVSVIALSLLFERLKRHWEAIDLTAIFGIALQTLCLVFLLLPLELRTNAIAWGMSWARTETPLPLLGVVIFPYILLSLFVSDRLRRSEHFALANVGEVLSLELGALLTSLSFVSPVTRSLNLGASFIVLFAVTNRRDRLNQKSDQQLIYFTHLVGLGAIAAIADAIFPNLKFSDWAMLNLGLAVIEWGFSALLRLNSERLEIWRKSAWELGTGLACLSYFLLVQDFGSSNLHLTQNLIWAIAPLALTGLGYIRSFSQAFPAIKLSILSLVAAQALTFPYPETRAIGLGIGVVLMFVNTLKLQKIASAAIGVGFGVVLVGSLLWQFSHDYGFIPRFHLFMNSAAIAAVVLMAIRHGLKFRVSELHPDRILPKIYSRAMDGWSLALEIPVYLLLTLLLMIWAISNYTFHNFLPDGFLTATCLITLTMLYRSIVESRGWAIYFVGWGVELLAYATVSLMHGSLTALAIANIGIGLAAQLLGDWWLAKKGWANFPSALHGIPIIYGVLGTLLRWNLFTEWTGLVTLGTALIVIGVGRRKPAWNAITYLALIAVTVSIYELIIYQLSRSTGGSFGDGLVILSMATTAIAIGYRLLSRILITYLRIEPSGLKVVAHIHWSFGAVLIILGALFAPRQFGGILGTCVGLVLAIYALLSGRRNSENEFWVYAGISALSLSGTYLLYFVFPNSILIAQILRPYAAAIASLVCIPLYLAPWDTWGWAKRPWQRSAIAIPILAVISTAIWISIPSLFIVAAFYSWVARIANSIRVSYLSLGFVNWALFQFFDQHQITNVLWYVSAIGFSLLYIVQVDPALITTDAKEQRHWLRMLGTGSICATSAIQSFDNPMMAWISLGIGLVFILGGLSLRVRSYLYVGTLTFIAEVIIQVATFVTRYSLLIWALGIFAGIVFIWIAANFEARRDRILALIRHVATELQAWE
jgi:hypothetical protein